MSYSPTSINTAALPANIGLVKYYVPKAVKNFKANTPALSVFNQQPLPLHSGVLIQ